MPFTVTNITQTDFEDTVCFEKTTKHSIIGFPKETDRECTDRVEVSAYFDGVCIAVHNESPSFIADSEGCRSEVDVKDAYLMFSLEEAEKFLKALTKAIEVHKSGELIDENSVDFDRENRYEWYL